MKSLINYILEQHQEVSLWKSISKDNTEALDVLSALHKLCDQKLKDKKYSLDNKDELRKVFNMFIECVSGRPRNFVISLLKKFGIGTEGAFRGFILSSHDQLEKQKFNIDWVKQWDETELQKEYKKAKENGEIETIADDGEYSERDLVVYDRWHPEEHETYQFKGSRGKSTDHQINLLRMDFGYNHDVKYYDCYPILTKNYFGHEQELVDRANSQIGYDDPNEFAE